MSGLVSSSQYIFAAKPDPGFMNSSNCKMFFLGAKPANTTCCWKESDGLVFCQTCTYTSGEGYTSCDDKELQLLEVPSTSPPSSSSGPAAPIQDDGTLEQPSNPNRGDSTNNPNTDKGILDSDELPNESIYTTRYSMVQLSIEPILKD